MGTDPEHHEPIVQMVATKLQPGSRDTENLFIRLGNGMIKQLVEVGGNYMWKILDQGHYIAEIAAGSSLYSRMDSGQILQYKESGNSGQWSSTNNNSTATSVIACGEKVYQICNERKELRVYNGQTWTSVIDLNHPKDDSFWGTDKKTIYNFYDDGVMTYVLLSEEETFHHVFNSGWITPGSGGGHDVVGSKGIVVAWSREYKHRKTLVYGHKYDQGSKRYLREFEWQDEDLLTEFRGGNAGICKLRKNGEIWLYTGNAQWKMIDNDRLNCDVQIGEEIYRRTLKHEIYMYEDGGWRQVQTPVAPTLVPK